MQHLAYKAYGEATTRTASDKQIELALFQQITEALRTVARQEDPALADWADAINRNQQLWSIIATDLLSDANKLPNDTKTSLIQISKFVRQHSLKVLAREATLDDLIEVNETIIAGLAGVVAAQDAALDAAQTEDAA